MHSRALFACFLLGCTATGAPEPSIHRGALTGAALDHGDPAVVLVTHKSATVSGLCTSTVVSPHVVLTAAHCVSAAMNGANATYRVYLGDDIRTGDASLLFAVKATHMHPDFFADSTTTRADVGVVITDAALPVTPLPMNRATLPSTLTGQTVRLVGYGVTNHADDPQLTAGIRRTMSTQVQGFDAELVRVGDATHNGCDGDSGSPLLLTIGGSEQLIGVMSFSDTACTILTGYARVDKYADSFVQAFIDAEDPPGMEVGASTNADAGTVGDAATDEAHGAAGCGMVPRAPTGPLWLALVIALCSARRHQGSRTSARGGVLRA